MLDYWLHRTRNPKNLSDGLKKPLESIIRHRTKSTPTGDICLSDAPRGRLTPPRGRDNKTRQRGVYRRDGVAARLWRRMGEAVWTVPELQRLLPFRTPKGVAGVLYRGMRRGQFERWQNPEWDPWVPRLQAFAGSVVPRWLWRRAGEPWW